MKKILFFMCGMAVISSAQALDLSTSITDATATTTLAGGGFYDVVGGATIYNAAGVSFNGEIGVDTDFINLNGETLNIATASGGTTPTTLSFSDTEIRDTLGGGTLNATDITLTDATINFNGTTWTNSNSYTLTLQGVSSYNDSGAGLNVNTLQTDTDIGTDVDSVVSLTGDLTANTIQDTGTLAAVLDISADNIDVTNITLDGTTDLIMAAQAIEVANFSKTGDIVDLTLDSLNSLGSEGNINWTNVTGYLTSYTPDSEIELYTATTNISGALTLYNDTTLYNTGTLALTGTDILFNSGSEILTVTGTTTINDSANPTNFEGGTAHFEGAITLNDQTTSGATLYFTDMSDVTVDGAITLGYLSELITTDSVFLAADGVTVGTTDEATLGFTGTSNDATVNGITLADDTATLTLQSETNTTISGMFNANGGIVNLEVDEITINNALWGEASSATYGPAVINVYSYNSGTTANLTFDGTTDFEDTQFNIYDDTSFSQDTLLLHGTDFTVHTGELFLNGILVENFGGTPLVEFNGDDGLNDFVTVAGETNVGGSTTLSLNLIDFSTNSLVNNGILDIQNADLTSSTSIVNRGSPSGGEIITSNIVDINANVQNIDGYITVDTGTTTINGTLSFESSALNDNSLQVAAGATLTVDSITNTGTLDYDVDNLRVASFINSGALTISSADLGFNGISASKTLENSGDVNIVGSGGAFTLNFGETIRNATDGVVNITEPNVIATNNGSITGGEIVINATGANFLNESTVTSDITVTEGTYTENRTGLVTTSADITVEDAGTFAVAGTVTTFTLSGELTLNDTATLTSAAGAFVIDTAGTMVIDGNTSLNLAGIENQGIIYTETGTGVVSVAGGTFTNTGQILGDQTITIDATGTWQQDGNLFTVNTDLINNGNFAFDPTVNTMTIANSFTNSGTLTNSDTVSLAINGGTWTENTAVIDFTNIQLTNGGTFALGTNVTDLNSNLEIQNGTLDLNNNSLAVTGDLNLRDSVVAIENNGTNNINVTGDASLNNVGFDFAGTATVLTAGDTLTLLTASGTFYSKDIYVMNWDDILGADLIGVFSESAGSLELEAIAEMNYESITSLSQNNHNMAEVMTLMQDITNRSAGQNQLLMHFATLANEINNATADPSELSGALELIRPQNIDAAVRTSAFLDNAVINQVSNHIDSNARYARLEEGFTPPLDSIWFDVAFNGMEYERLNDFKAYESKGGTVSVGRETAFVRNHIFGGIVGSLSKTETIGKDEDETESTFEIESQAISLTAYTQMISKFISFYGAVGGSFQNHDLERTTFLGKTARAEYDQLNYFGKVGAEISLLNFLIPGASLTHQHLEGIAYTEEGAEGETLNVKGDDAELTHLNLSLRLQLEFKQPGLKIIPYIKGEKRTLLSETDGVEFQNSFTEENGLAGFSNTTNEFEEELTVISAGIDIFEAMNATKTTIMYQMQKGEKGTETQVGLQVNMMF